MKIYIQLHIPILCSEHLSLFRPLQTPASEQGAYPPSQVCQLDVFSDLPTIGTHGKKMQDAASARILLQNRVVSFVHDPG